MSAAHILFQNNNLLLTEREGRTGEYWPEVVAVRTERSEVRTKTTEGQYSPVRLELARLVSSLFYYMEESVLLGTKPLVDSIRHFIRDPSGVFSVCHLCECRIVQ